MRLEILIQFIVPLTFLAIWALTSLLNRDAQPLPPRPGRPGGGPGMGPRPSGRMPGPGEGRPMGSPFPPRPAPPGPAAQGPEGDSAWPPPGTPGPARERPRPRPMQNLDDAIVYIENGTMTRGGQRNGPGSPAAGSSPGARSPRASQTRRGLRGRGTAGTTPPVPPRTEPEPQRALSDMVNQSLALRKARPLEITPLSAPITGLSRSLSDASAVSETRSRSSRDGRPTLTGGEIRGLLAAHGKIREVVLLSEILQPPLALRRARRES